LAAAGGAIGVLLAKWGLSAITRLNALSPQRAANPLYLPGAHDIRLDGLVLAFTIALALATGILFGLFPSLQISRPDLAGVLRESGATAGLATTGKRAPLGINPRGLLVVSEIALSVVLLIGAALLLQSFARLHGVNPGFQTANLLTTKIALPPAHYDTDAKRAAFFGELVESVKTLPGVRDATMAMTLPTTTWIRTNILTVEGRPKFDPMEAAHFAVFQSITPDYFRTLKIPLRIGREFNAGDNASGARPVLIINETLARQLWPEYPNGENPVGRHIQEGYDKNVGWLEIVGVAADVHEGGLASDAAAEFYVPCVVHPPQTAYLAVRTEGEPLHWSNAIRNQVRAIDPDQSIADVKTMDAVFEGTLGQRRMTMLLLGTFAGIALLLAVIGIYGVIAYSAAQRTREMGIRRALGAQQTDILRLMLGQGLVLALGGVVAGIGGAFALTRVVKSLLFQVSATDPATFVGIALSFIAVALAASYFPARRASPIDPTAALR
jgi:predicted permease